MPERRIQQVLVEALARLEAVADRRRAAAAQRYFREPVVMFGVPAADIRRQARELGARLRGTWPAARLAQLCDALVRRPELEAKSLGLLLLADAGPELADRLLPRIRCWLAWHCGNWATADLAGSEVLGPLLGQRPERAAEFEAWAGSSQLWVRRAAAVALVAQARRGRLLGPAYRIADLLLVGGEDAALKAAGWLLKEAGRTDRTRLSAYLLERGPSLPRIVVRTALEGFPLPERRLLLDATRAHGAAERPAPRRPVGAGAAAQRRRAVPARRRPRS